MSRKAAKTPPRKGSVAKNSKSTQPAAPSEPRRPLHGILRRLLNLPRLIRITFVAITALLIALILTPLITDAHWRYAYTFDTYYAPAVITILFACIMYVVGWRLIVGTPGEPIEPRKAHLWYFAVIGCILLAGLAWIVVTAIPAFMEA